MVALVYGLSGSAWAAEDLAQDAFLRAHNDWHIAKCLTADGIPSPSASDPIRNPQRLANGPAWKYTAVRAILENPRYTGYQVWNKQRRDEVLIDVHDVGLGHQTGMRWNDPLLTGSSPKSRSEEALITREEWEAVRPRGQHRSKA